MKPSLCLQISTIPTSSNIVRNVGQWWQHPSAKAPDSGICAYVVSTPDCGCKANKPSDIAQDLQRIMSRSLDFLYSGTSSVSGLQIDCDYLVVTKTIETQLLAWRNEWQNFRRYAETELSLCHTNNIYACLITQYTPWSVVLTWCHHITERLFSVAGSTFDVSPRHSPILF